MSPPVPFDDPERMRIVVPSRQSKIRIDLYLTRKVENATRTRVQKAITDGLVLVDGKPVKPSHPVSPGETIDITFPRPRRTEAVPEDIPLAIVHEDDSLLIVNKPAGMVTHPAYGNYTGTLVNALLHHVRSLPKSHADLRPGIVHRLDKDTTGLMVVAKTDEAHQFLARQFARRTIDREYWAIVWGTFTQDRGVIDASLGRSKKDRKKIAVVADGKHALTEFEVLQRFELFTLIRLKLKTGRTHQIRVHLAHVGHPVLGDPTYGGRNSSWGGLTATRTRHATRLLTLITRQALHAKTIGFIHPESKLHTSFDSELPEDMQTVLDML